MYILGKDVKILGMPERLMLSQKIDVYISNYQYCIAWQTLLQKHENGNKGQIFHIF